MIDELGMGNAEGVLQVESYRLGRTAFGRFKIERGLSFLSPEKERSGSHTARPLHVSK
jgi:hypothetical protein